MTYFSKWNKTGFWEFVAPGSMKLILLKQHYEKWNWENSWPVCFKWAFSLLFDQIFNEKLAGVFMSSEKPEKQHSTIFERQPPT